MWYTITAVIVGVAALIIFRGFTLGIDFEGGSRIQMPAAAKGASAPSRSRRSTRHAGHGRGVGADRRRRRLRDSIQIRSEALDPQQVDKLQEAMFSALQPTDSTGTPNRNEISVSDVSETWGEQITRKALIALALFFVLAASTSAFRFEGDMAVAALVGALPRPHRHGRASTRSSGSRSRRRR